MRLLRTLEKNASQFSVAFKSLKYLALGSAGVSRSFGVPYTYFASDATKQNCSSFFL